MSITLYLAVKTQTAIPEAFSLFNQGVDPIEPDGSAVPPTIRDGFTKIGAAVYWIVAMVILMILAYNALKILGGSKSRGEALKNIGWGVLAFVVVTGVSWVLGITEEARDWFF